MNDIYAPVKWAVAGSGGKCTPDSKVHGANMGPAWDLSAPDGSHVGPTNLAIRGRLLDAKPLREPKTDLLAVGTKFSEKDWNQNKVILIRK